MENYVSSLIKIASNDLKSAKILYKKEFYAQSLFLLQQSIEKTYKAIGLLTRQIDIQELKDVSHDYIKMLKKGLSCINETALEKIITSEIKKFDNNSEGEPRGVIDLINRTKNKEFFNLSEEDIQNIFESIKKYKRINYPLKYTKTKNLLELYNAAMQNKNLTVQEINEIQELINNTNEGLSKVESINCYYFITNFYTLNLMGLITSPNFEQSRYPIIQNNGIDVNCPTELYLKETPIIKNQKVIIRYVEKAIKFLQNDLQ